MVLEAIYYNSDDIPVSVEVSQGEQKRILPFEQCLRMASDFENVTLVDGRFFRSRKGMKRIERRHISEGHCRSNVRPNKQIGTAQAGGCQGVQGQNKGKTGEQYGVNQSGEACNGVLWSELGGDNSSRVRNCPAICGIVNASFLKPEFFKRKFMKEHRYLNKYTASCVDIRETCYLKNCKCISFDNNKAFVAVDSTGEIVSLMRSPRSSIKKFTTHALAHAINNGGDKLCCYAYKGRGLGYIYASHGFIPVCKISFDWNYAPEGWKEEWGTPDLMFFMYVGDSVNKFVENSLSLKYPTLDQYDYIPNVNEFSEWYKSTGIDNDYDFGAYIRDIVLEKWKSKYRSSFRGKITEFVKYILKGVK